MKRRLQPYARRGAAHDGTRNGARNGGRRRRRRFIAGVSLGMCGRAESGGVPSRDCLPPRHAHIVVEFAREHERALAVVPQRVAAVADLEVG